MGDAYAFSGRVAADVVRAQLAGAVAGGRAHTGGRLGAALAYDAGATLVINDANSAPE